MSDLRLKKCLAIFSLFFICVLSKNALACSCGTMLPFIDIYTNKYPDITVPPNLVIQGKVINSFDRSFVVEVKTVLKGSYNKSTIAINGNGGVACIRNATDFAEGTDWIFIIDTTGFPNISACGEYALRIINSDTVKSNNLEKYSKEPQYIKLDELYKLLSYE